MRKLRHERRPQPFARISQRIDEHNFLQNRKLAQRAPRIISASKKYHWSHHHAEHQSDVLLIYAASERQSSAGREAGNQQRDADKEERVREMQFQSRPENDPGQRNHHQACDERLNQAGNDLFDRDPRDVNRRLERSSISRVNWNSAINGIATAQIPVKTMLIAMIPGRSRLL